MEGIKQQGKPDNFHVLPGWIGNIGDGEKGGKIAARVPRR